MFNPFFIDFKTVVKKLHDFKALVCQTSYFC